MTIVADNVEGLNVDHQESQHDLNVFFMSTSGPLSTVDESPEVEGPQVVFKDEMISVDQENCPSNARRKSEVHFWDEDDSGEDSKEDDQLNHQYQTQHSTMSGKSFRLTHRTSFLNIHHHDGLDEIDSLPGKMSFTYLDAMALLFSVGTYIFDIVTDVTVATLHYLNGNYLYFALTVAFVAFPTLVMTAINLRWYIVDSREPTSPKVSKWRWACRVLVLLLQFGPIMRYIDAILFGLMFRKYKESHGKKSRITRKHFQYMMYEDADATMLRLFECFLEAAPQLVLQMYIIAASDRKSDESDWTFVVQVISVNASLISLSWSLVSYLRILRLSLPTKVNMSWPGTIIQFFWRYFMIASRVLALALFASIFTYHIAIVCLIHWAAMLGWIISMKTNFCNNLLEELIYNAVLAVIFIFCYFNPVDSPTRRRYTLYYTAMFVENVVLMTLWYHACEPGKWYRLPAFVAFFACFGAALVFMIIYYLKLHPTNNIQVFSPGTAQPPAQVNKVSTIGQQSPVYSISSTVECSSQPSNSTNSTSPSRLNPTSSLNYLRQFSEIWTTQNRLLHPRPTIPNI